MKLIDADTLNYVRVRIYHDDGTIGGYNAVVPSSEIKKAPTVELIQCKDCKWWNTDEDECWLSGLDTDGYEYCSWAERKE